MKLRILCFCALLIFVAANQEITQNVSSVNQSNPNCEKKSWLTALLLSIFVGGFGADQFYLGWITDGCMKLLLLLSLFCWGCCCGILNTVVRCITQLGENKTPWPTLIIGLFGGLGSCCCSMALFAYCLANIIMIATRFQKPYGCSYTDDK
jgi:TM2 domain-containing membrane protein YozV